MFPTFYQGPPSWFAAQKEIFSAENSISLQKIFKDLKLLGMINIKKKYFFK